MTAIDHCVSREFGNDFQKTVHHLFITATIEVGTSNTHTEEGVASKGNALFFIIEGDTTGCMAWGLQYLKGVMTESDRLARFEIMTYLRVLTMQRETDHRLKLAWQIVDEVGVICRDLYLQPIGLEDEVIAEVMIEVSMRSQQMNGFQLLGFDIVLNAWNSSS